MSIPQQVTKVHATGNDFVVYADPDGRFEPTADEVRWLTNRHFGIGGDGVIRLSHPHDVSDLSSAQIDECCLGGAEWFMDYRNADGSLAQMCGNGTRAITLFAQSRGYAASGEGAEFHLGTRAGAKTLVALGDMDGLGCNVFRVEMGQFKRGELDAYEVSIPVVSGSARGTFVDMGNPHVVTVLSDGTSNLPDIEALDLSVKPQVAPVLQSDQNVEFVRVDKMDAATGIGEATMRVHERGCGETLSCGTGLCATAVTLCAKTGVECWVISVRGGMLRVEVNEAASTVRLIGSATLVGDITLL